VGSGGGLNFTPFHSATILRYWYGSLQDDAGSTTVVSGHSLKLVSRIASAPTSVAARR
jgi:hypothetical protein